MIGRGVCGVGMMIWAVAAGATVPTRGFAAGGSVAYPVQSAFQHRLAAAPHDLGPWIASGFAAPCPAVRAGGVPVGDCAVGGAMAAAGPELPTLDALDALRLPTAPESDLWLQLLTGFGLAGFVVRLRRVGIESVVA